MTWAVPSGFDLLLLSLAAFRTFKLLADDSILDGPRNRWIVGRHEKAELFLTCPWCAGFWIGVGWWLAWVASPHWATVAAVPLAVSAVIAGLALLYDLVAGD